MISKDLYKTFVSYVTIGKCKPVRLVAKLSDASTKVNHLLPN